MAISARRNATMTVNYTVILSVYFTVPSQADKNSSQIVDAVQALRNTTLMRFKIEGTPAIVSQAPTAATPSITTAVPSGTVPPVSQYPMYVGMGGIAILVFVIMLVGAHSVWNRIGDKDPLRKMDIPDSLNGGSFSLNVVVSAA